MLVEFCVLDTFGARVRFSQQRQRRQVRARDLFLFVHVLTTTPPPPSPPSVRPHTSDVATLMGSGYRRAVVEVLDSDVVYWATLKVYSYE